MESATRGQMLAANLRAARERAALSQRVTAARMQALGYTEWYNATVSNVETGKRRVMAEEVMALAVVFETNTAALMSQESPDGTPAPISPPKKSDAVSVIPAWLRERVELDLRKSRSRLAGLEAIWGSLLSRSPHLIQPGVLEEIEDARANVARDEAIAALLDAAKPYFSR